MGLPNSFAKDTQVEEMTGRENQFALYVRDRWTVTPKLTVSAGVRLEYYPLMTRANSGIEILDYTTYIVTLGGRRQRAQRRGHRACRSCTSRRAPARRTAWTRRRSSAPATA